MRTITTELGSLVWQCILCEKVIKYKNNLREHIIGQHHDNNFYCTQCGKIVKTKAALRMHVKRNHPTTMEQNSSSESNIVTIT